MSQKPTYIYKLVPSSDPPSVFRSLPDRLPLSALDTHSGFIHLSTALQLPGTLERYFADEPQMYVLRIDYSHVEKDIRWEDPKGEAPGEIGGEGIYPHLYNDGKLGKGEVESVIHLEKLNNADWSTLKITESDWLIY